ncbi:MAG: hypothetical protein M1289_00500 [Patescibacteria group bacterium]|nr:hypothetical protein [Patescibacteria group bacterium]
MNSKTKVMVFAIVIIVGLAGFFAGMEYKKHPGNTHPHNRQLYLTGKKHKLGKNARIPVRGQIIATGSGTITVQMPDGTSKIIVLSGNTKITKSIKGSANDLKKGERILVIGKKSANGSVTAENIELNLFQK